MRCVGGHNLSTDAKVRLPSTYQIYTGQVYSGQGICISHSLLPYPMPTSLGPSSMTDLCTYNFACSVLPFYRLCTLTPTYRPLPPHTLPLPPAHIGPLGPARVWLPSAATCPHRPPRPGPGLAT